MVELRLLALLRLLDHSVGPYEALHLTHQSSLPTLIQCHLGRLLQFADLRLRHLQRPQTFCNEFRQIRFSMHKKRVCDGEEQRGRNLLLVTSWGCRPIIIRRGWCGGRRVVVGRVQHGLNVTVWTHPDRASIVVSKGKNLILTATINTLWSAKKQIFVSKNGRWKHFFYKLFTCESEAVLPPFWDNLRGCCKFIFGSKSDKGFCCCCCCSRVLAIIFATGLCLVGMVKPLPNLGKVPPLAVRLLAECWCIKMRRSGFLLDNAISTSS